MSSFNRLFALAFAMLFCAAAFIQGATPVVYANVATYVVDNTGDADLASNASACANSGQNNDCSLRQAIELANQDGGASSITFNIPTDDANYSSGTWTIRPNSDLPPLSEGETTILGTADQINPSLPAIIINGSNVPASSAVGLTISSADNRIERLAILDFNGNLATTGIGIHITGPNASGNVVRGSFIGVRPGDTTATTLADRQRVGIQIDGGASGNFIGEAASLLSDRNFIAGNGLSTGDGGIIILQSNNNTIQNNYIGFNLAGSAFVDLGNTGSGIQVINSAGNTIGGTVAGATPLRNYIANNTQYGIVITGDPSDNNLVAGNYIGVNVDGTSARPNALDGVIIAGSADNNTISGNAAVRSVISGNTQYGVRITAVGTTGNRIQGVYIGTNAAGTAAIPNVIGGVRVENSANGNVVGGESAALGNLISGNPVGVSIGAAEGFTVQNTVVAGNVVGLNAAGTAAVPNTSRGISIEARARQTTIGGGTSGEGHYIPRHGGPGGGVVGRGETPATPPHV
ncbi:MAG TPA: hypothetical protein PKA05_17385, partial [Roseiflexaceae bacterium]|nr:hypothetical protein [Roseiflexaceae bacterium]